MSEEAPAVKFDTYGILYHSTMLIFSALGGGIQIFGSENVPKSGAVLLVSNHISYLDPCAIGDACPRRVLFMGKAELFRVKILSWLLRGVDCFPVKRGEADPGAFRTTLTRLKEGRCVCIFPEGTRSPDGTLQKAEAGAGLFATRTGCAVVPVYVRGTDTILDRRGRLHRGRLSVAFGEPFRLKKETGRDEAAAEMMTRIAAVRDGGNDSGGLWLRLGPLRKPREGWRAEKH